MSWNRTSAYSNRVLECFVMLTENESLSELTSLFCKNQHSFYSYIAKYMVRADNEEANSDKPLRLHTIANSIDCIFSRNHLWSFYNATLDTDIFHTIKQGGSDPNQAIQRILSLASLYKCSIRSTVKSTASDAGHLLKRYGFFELPSRSDAYQYIDFHQFDHSSKCTDLSSDIKIYELDGCTQTDCEQKKAEWGYVLCESFGMSRPELHGPFYSKIWSRVQVGPSTPVRMFFAIKNDRVVDGYHASLACGVACLCNVTTLKSERGQGIGKALSMAAMNSAQQLNYRYMVLQSSEMGSPVYKGLDFDPTPPYKVFVKLSTMAWYFKIVEVVVQLFGIPCLQQFIDVIRKPITADLLISTIGIISLAACYAIIATKATLINLVLFLDFKEVVSIAIFTYTDCHSRWKSPSPWSSLASLRAILIMYTTLRMARTWIRAFCRVDAKSIRKNRFRACWKAGSWLSTYEVYPGSSLALATSRKILTLRFMGSFIRWRVRNLNACWQPREVVESMITVILRSKWMYMPTMVVSSRLMHWLFGNAVELSWTSMHCPVHDIWVFCAVVRHIIKSILCTSNTYSPFPQAHLENLFWFWWSSKDYSSSQCLLQSGSPSSPITHWRIKGHKREHSFSR